MRKKIIMLLLIQSLLTSCYNMSQSDLPKVQPSKAPIVNTSIKPTQVKPSTIAVNQGNNVNSNTTSTIANSDPVVLTTPIPTVTSNTSSSTNLSGGSTSTNSNSSTSSSSSTTISTPDVKEITFTPNPNYNYPPPSINPNASVSVFDASTYIPPKDHPPIYNQNDPIRDIPPLQGLGSVFFKDEFKIRMQTDGTLYSQTGADMSSINKLFLDYKVKVIVNYSVGTTQAELDKIEKDAEAFYQSDIPNDASIYRMEFTSADTNVKEFFEKLRADTKVLSANYGPAYF